MLKQDKKHLLIEHEDLIIAMTRAKNEKNNSVLSKLMNLFIDFSNISEEGYLELNKNDDIAIYIMNTKGVFVEESLITPNLLALALSRAIYEYNHEMKKIIQKYLIALMDAKIKEEDPQVVINLILDDKKVSDYITKFATYDDYIREKQKIPKKEKKQDIQKVNSRSHVIM